MKKVISLLLVLVMVLGMFAGCSTQKVNYKKSTVILYTGNVRGNVEVYPQIAAAKAAYEAKGATVYLVDAGNYLQGTAEANTDRGLSIYNLMDAAGYDVAAMGMYEFVYGDATTGYAYHGNVTKYFTQAELYKGAEALEYQKNAPWAEEKVMDNREAKAAASFKVICSNLTAGAENSGFYAFDSNAVLGDTLKIGFVSSVEEKVTTHVQDGFLAGYTFGNVSNPTCDLVVALGSGTGDIVIKAPADGEMVVGAYVINNKTKAITEETVDMTGSDANVAALVAKLAPAKVVGTSSVTLNGADSVNWNGESNLGNLTADALKWYAENKMSLQAGVPVVAIQNGGNCDNFIYTGEITEVDLLKALPFSPMGVGVMYVTGAELLETLEAATQKENCPGWAQVAGIEYTVDTTKPYDAGEAYGDFFKATTFNRVTIQSVGGAAFDATATYAVIADNFLMNGNDTYYTFAEIKEADASKYVNNGNELKTRDIVAMYISEVLGGKVGSDYADGKGNISIDTEASTLNKIVIYISSLGTVLDAFDKTDCIVGAYGSLADKYGVPSCGKWNEVDVEAVIATGADAVFGYKNYTTKEQIAQLNAAGIQCYFIELSDANTAAAEVEQLGTLFGCEDKAKAFVDLYNKYDALLKERLEGKNLLNVYVEGTSSTPKTANNTSAAHALVTGAGLNNLYAENTTQYPERNLEDVITKNPDIIVKLLGSSGKLDDATYEDYKTGLAGVAAADSDKIILLNNECGTTAIGAIIGRLYIAKFAYPELFADVDVDAVYTELYTNFLGSDFPGTGAFFK